MSLLHTHQLSIQEQLSHQALVVDVGVRLSYQKITALMLIAVGQQCWHYDFQLLVFVKQVIVKIDRHVKRALGKEKACVIDVLWICLPIILLRMRWILVRGLAGALNVRLKRFCNQLNPPYF